MPGTTTVTTVTFERVSGVPADRVVNTFHAEFIFDPTTANLTAWHADLVDFYNADRTGGDGLHAYISAIIDRTAGASKIKTYNLADATPRVPIFESTFALAAATSDDALPAEVAVVLSLAAAPASGIPASRLRGRLYLGPLAFDASTLSTSEARPSVNVRNRLKDSALALIGRSGDPRWSIYSPRMRALGSTLAASTHEITHGFIDNAFDTQRRRGPDATVRTTF